MASADKLRHTKVADKSQIAKEFVQFSKADNHVGFFDLIILRLMLIDKPMLVSLGTSTGSLNMRIAMCVGYVVLSGFSII
jgi:hypothetical protein